MDYGPSNAKDLDRVTLECQRFGSRSSKCKDFAFKAVGSKIFGVVLLRQSAVGFLHRQKILDVRPANAKYYDQGRRKCNRFWM